MTALETLIASHGVPAKKKTLDKVYKQLAGLSALVDLWWQTVQGDVEHMALPPRWQHWVDELLLPLRSWQHHVSHTRCADQKAQIAPALKTIHDALARHPCPGWLGPAVLAAWKAWAADHAKAFQRASSAVEGRQGSVSQRPHNHRGLPTCRSPVWTALHNCDGRASDGTTPASRFFRRGFPDLFETVLSQINELPRPRQRQQALAVSD